MQLGLVGGRCGMAIGGPPLLFRSGSEAQCGPLDFNLELTKAKHHLREAQMLT